jgi:branched-chain amino acid transport system ATP-binding protein
MSSILSVKDIQTFIGQFHILEGVSFEVPANSVTVLLGRNGAGKTTTLRSIIGLNPPVSGTVTYKGEGVQGQRAFTIAAKGIGYVPEHRAIFKDLTVEENLKVAERQRGDLDRRRNFIFEVFPDLGRLYSWPGGQLSGGQQQMLAIARVLVPDNELLLIDEPSEGLAPVIIEQMMNALRQLSSSTTVLLVEQNLRVATELATQYVIIEDGHSVHHGLVADLVKDESLITRYLGAA